MQRDIYRDHCPRPEKITMQVYIYYEEKYFFGNRSFMNNKNYLIVNLDSKTESITL